MSDHFGIENRMVIEDDYKSRTPKLSFDMRRGYPIPMIENISAEEIESMAVMQLRREAELAEAMEITQNQMQSIFNAEQVRNERLTDLNFGDGLNDPRNSSLNCIRVYIR